MMLNLARLASVALLLLSVLTPLSASEIPVRRAATNAERLARGLAPARPRRLYSPSRTNAARAAPSAVPGVVVSGKIGIYTNGNSGEAPIGFLGRYGIVASSSDTFVLTLTYTVPDPADALIELAANAGPSYRLSAIALRSGASVSLGPGVSTAVILGITSVHTPAGSPVAVYVYDAFAIGFAQTTIFRVDPTTGRVTVHWVNGNGAVIPQSLVRSDNGVYVTADPAALAAGLGKAVTPVELYFDVGL